MTIKHQLAIFVNSYIKPYFLIFEADKRIELIINLDN